MKESVTYLGKGRSFPNIDKAIDDIQNIVRTGYKNCSRRTYLMRLGYVESTAAECLKSFTDKGLLPPPKYNEPSCIERINKLVKRLNAECSCIYLDIGFTFSGLEKNKVQSDLLEVFRRKSPAFYDNAFSRAQKHLGDTGLSAPQHWDKPYQDQDPDGGFDMVLIAHFPHNTNTKPPTENDDFVREFETRMAQELLMLPSCANFSMPMTGQWIEVSVPLEDASMEHFGYRDGITAPVYDKALVDTPKIRKHDVNGYRGVHELGEILLGHARNDHDNLYSHLNLTRKGNPEIALQSTPVEEQKKKFFLNSSFGVLRKMEQKVELFEKWVDAQAKATFPQDVGLGLPSEPSDAYYISKKWIRSKLMGRTPEGVMLTPQINLRDLVGDGPKTIIGGILSDPGSEAGFSRKGADGEPTTAADSQGKACPFSSHIRRMNPRDDPVTPFIHRPLIRRGMTYIQGDKKGLSGLFICADLVEQFEHLVGAWANHRVLGIPDDSTCRDPIIGNHEPQNNRLYLNSQDNGEVGNSVRFDEPFVITRGCAYIWFPAKSTLTSLDQYTSKAKS